MSQLERSQSDSNGTTGRRNAEKGQAMITVVLCLALFLIAGLAFAVDYTRLLYHRQRAQVAADAACMAGAMDVFEKASGVSLPASGFTPGVAASCPPGTSSNTICFYARVNGYNGTGLVNNAPSSLVSWSFPSSVPGVTAAPTQVAQYPFLKVSVQENVKAYLSPLITHSGYQKVAATATCALTQLMEGDVILLLHPTASGAFLSSGSAGIKIVGGTIRGVQVNSSSSSAVLVSGSPTIDLSHGGPNYTGSDFGLTGGPSSPVSGFSGGTTGHWVAADVPLLNPYAGLAVPASVKLITPLNGTGGKAVSYGTDGCPDHTSGCREYWPGYYPSGITVSGSGTLIFNAGIYYFDGSVTTSGGSTLRMALPAGRQPTDGLMFYFHSGSIVLSGGSTSHTLDATPSTVLTCDGSVPNSSLGIPSGLTGHVLVGQCTRKGTYYDAGHDTSDSLGSQRGLVFFEDNADSSSPTLSGTSGMGFAGNMYFHSNSYADTLALSGGSGVFAATWGSIITDKMALSGTSTVSTLLNPSGTLPTVKLALVQ